jgi:tellurite resistance protein TehA-like permease
VLPDQPPGGGFAFVMATGIVSIAAKSQDLTLLSNALLVINLIAFPLLSARMLRRLVEDPAALFAELSNHQTAPAFLTFVAAVAVLGDEFAIQTAWHHIATALWFIGAVSWAGFIYAFFTLLTTRSLKPSPLNGPDGSWLLIVVATEAMAVLGSYINEAFFRHDVIIYLSICWFLLGGFFYLIIISMIVQRWLFGALSPTDLGSPYWINMGAMAIASLAGSRLQSLSGPERLTSTLLPAIATATTLCWTVATWWIPLLIVLMIWRHTSGRVSLAYRVEYWSMVFPFGMYTVATWTYSDVNNLEFLYWIPRVFVWAAVFSWIACFTGMIRRSAGFATRALDHRRKTGSSDH